MENTWSWDNAAVDYTLLETCFIDDMDDMAFYEKNKNNMAKTVADSIASFYAG